MRTILSNVFLACILAPLASVSWALDLEKESDFVLSTSPQGAAVFHYLRGKNLFLGYTPLKLSRDDLDGRQSARFRFLKFGYHEKLAKLPLSGLDTVSELEPGLEFRLTGETTAELSTCSDEIKQVATGVAQAGMRSQLGFQYPFFLAETRDGVELRIVTKIVNQNDIKKIKRVERTKENDAQVAEFVASLVEPTVFPLITAVEALACVDAVAVVASLQVSGLKIDATPYEEVWASTSELYVGGSKIVTTTIGTEVKFSTDVVQTRKRKNYLFTYRLR
ncbi:MAG: hypothetical protein AAGH76_10625 [Pseudomonadota bacterium]